MARSRAANASRMRATSGCRLSISTAACKRSGECLSRTALEPASTNGKRPSGVNDADYQPPFPLTAKLNKLTIKVDRPQLSPEDIKKLEAGMQQAADAK